MASESKSGAAAGPGANKRPARPTTGRRHSTHDAERQARMLLYGATAAIVLIALGLVAFGYYWSVIKPRHRSVLEAEGVKVTYTAMVRRMEYEYYTSAVFQQQPGALPEATYLNVLNEITLTTRAEKDLSISLSDDEVNQQLRRKIGVSQEADDKTFTDRYRAALKSSGLHDSEYRRLAKAEALEQKVRDKFQSEAPATVAQAKLDVVATKDEAAARDAINRINAGEDFATVAKALSSESDVQTTGGAKDFAPQGSFNAVYDDYAFTGEIGKLSEPLAGPNDTFYVVRVDAREDRALTEDQKPAYVTRQYSQWLSSTQETMGVKRDWDTTAQRDALIKVLKAIDPNRQQQPLTLPTVAQQLPAAPADNSVPPPSGQ